MKIYYDGECPFCARYVRLLHLQRAAGGVELVNLRDNPRVRHELQAGGHDLDEGMVVETGGRRLGGADAINALALLSTPSDLFNRANRRVLSSPALANLIYPILRSGRWLTLFLLGRAGLAEEDRGLAARAAIFGSFFALFSIFHFFNYAFEYNRFPPQWDQFALLLSAVALLLRPHSARLLWLVMLVSTISTAVQAPVSSNHTMVRSALLLGYWASFFLAVVRGSRWSTVFTNFTVAGQGTLLVMYAFGIFHKINTDFLNPETSCAVALWKLMPAPINWLDGPIIHQATIYGTFVVEGAIVLMLLTPRLRHYGIVAGILFHILIALSSYAMYITFTMLSIALHVLFLGSEGAEKILGSRGLRMLRMRLIDPLYMVTGLLLFAGLALAAVAENYSLVTMLASPFVLPFCLLVVHHGRSTRPLLSPETKGDNRAAVAIGAIVTVLFFANCAMPYLGLKSAQAINMFANLRLEGGVSNHLVLPHPPRPFGYLEDIGIIVDSGGDAGLEGLRQGGYGIVYYDLLVRLKQNPELFVSFTRAGRTYENVSAADLTEDIGALLHPAWFRKWFHFQPAKLETPEPCNV